MTDRSSLCSGGTSVTGNGIKEAKEKPHHLQSTATTMSTFPVDEAKEDKKVSWETMLPSNRTNTIGKKKDQPVLLTQP